MQIEGVILFAAHPALSVGLWALPGPFRLFCFRVPPDLAQPTGHLPHADF